MNARGGKVVILGVAKWLSGTGAAPGALAVDEQSSGQLD
jgi:hypothetical protein